MDVYEGKSAFFSIIKGIAISLIFTVISLILYSIILVYTNVSEDTASTVIIVITGISILIGSSIGTLKIKKRGLLNGGIIGGSYIIIIYLISSAVNSNFSLNLTSIIMIAVGIMGGILRRNNRGKQEVNQKEPTPNEPNEPKRRDLGKMSKLKNTGIIFTLVIFMSSISNASYIWSSGIDITTDVSTEVMKENTDDTTNPLNLDCGSAILVEATSGEILYSYNMHEQLRPASVTKLMSILLIMEAIEKGQINYDTRISCSENAASMGGSQIWLDTTESLTVDEMLKAICVVSANDCVVAMAEFLAGSEEAFVQKMNDKAKELGMNDTCYKNCHGIDEDGHLTSSYDIAILSRELLNKYPEITKYTTIWNDTLRDGKSALVNTNKLVHNYSGCTGLKTGSTSLALFNLSASATRDGMTLIAVVMKAPTSTIRFSTAKTLLDYGFNNFEYKVLANCEDTLRTVSVEKGIKHDVDLKFEKSCGTVISKGNGFNIEHTINLNDNIKAPISKGDVLGNVSFTVNGTEIENVNLIAASSVDKINVLSMVRANLGKWMNLTRVR